MIQVCEKRYNLSEAAEVIGVSKRTIQRAIKEGYDTAGKSGIYPVEQIGPRPVVPAHVLDAWARSHRVEVG